MNEDGIPHFDQHQIVHNWHKLSRPYETPIVDEHFTFSYGKLLNDVTLSEDIKFLNDFDYLQQLLTMKYRDAGYTLYVMSEALLYRRIGKSKCNTDFLLDQQYWKKPFSREQYMYRRQIEEHRAVEKSVILRKILQNQRYLNYMIDRWEIDIEKQRYTWKA